MYRKQLGNFLFKLSQESGCCEPGIWLRANESTPFCNGPVDVCYVLNSGAKADIAGGPSQAKPNRVMANRLRCLAHSSTQNRVAIRCARVLRSRLAHALCQELAAMS